MQEIDFDDLDSFYVVVYLNFAFDINKLFINLFIRCIYIFHRQLTNLKFWKKYHRIPTSILRETENLKMKLERTLYLKNSLKKCAPRGGLTCDD